MLNLKKLPFLLILIVLIGIGLTAYNSQKPLGGNPQIDISQYVLNQMLSCHQDGLAPPACFKQAAAEIRARFALKDILTVIEQNQNQPEIFQTCHEMTHFLGREEYNQVKAVGEAIPRCTAVCFAGCYHGVLEGYLIDKNSAVEGKDDSLIAKEIPTLCGKKEDYSNNEQYNQCLHGLGHALMFLKEADLPASLKLCDELKTRSDQEWCYSGAFMENSTSSTNQDHPSKYIKADDPMYPCTILDEKYLNMCYALQSFYFAQVANYDWNKTIALCYQVPATFQPTCFRSIGQNLVGFTQDFETIKENCSLIIKNELERACIQGAVLALSSKYGGDYSYILDFCSVVNEKNKGICYSQMGISMKNWVKDQNDLVSICSAVTEKSYRDFCLEPKITNTN